MARNPELDKLLREVDSLTSSVAASEAAQETEESRPPSQAKKSSTFLDAVGGFFISRVEDEETQQQVDTPPPSPNTVADVAGSVPTPEFAPTGTDDYSNRPLIEIYREAGVDESSFTVDKLFELLQDPSLKDQPLSTKTLVLKMALKSQNVEPTVPVTDAVSRDKALDGYQKMLNKLAMQTEAENAKRVQQIQEEANKVLQQLNAEMDKLRTQTAEAKRQAESFAARRLQEEQRLAEIILPLLEGHENPVSVGNKVD